jgi:hypothetical protein
MRRDNKEGGHRRWGTPGGPALYNAAVGFVFTQASKEWRAGGHGFIFHKGQTTHLLPILAYADDTTLLATSVNSMLYMLGDADRRLNTLGQANHPGKSELIWSKSPDATITSPIRLREKVLPLVTETTIVGTTWSFGHKPDSQLKHRLKCAWAKARTNTLILRSPHLRPGHRLWLLWSLIHAVALYGCEAWLLSGHVLQTIHRTQRALSRWTLRLHPPRHDLPPEEDRLAWVEWATHQHVTPQGFQQRQNSSHG